MQSPLGLLSSAPGVLPFRGQELAGDQQGWSRVAPLMSCIITWQPENAGPDTESPLMGEKGGQRGLATAGNWTQKGSFGSWVNVCGGKLQPRPD